MKYSTNVIQFHLSHSSLLCFLKKGLELLTAMWSICWMCTNISKNNNRHSNPAPKKKSWKCGKRFFWYLFPQCAMLLLLHGICWMYRILMQSAAQDEEKDEKFFPFSPSKCCCAVVFKSILFLSPIHIPRKSDIGIGVLCYLPNNIFV